MAWTTIAASQTDADSDLNETLFNAIRNNLDDLDGRVTPPVGHISGGVASISSDTEIEMSALYAADSEGEEVIEIAAQTLDITVAADCITGSVPSSYTDLTLHVFAGLKTGESAPQFYLSESISPSGFDYYRYVGSYLCDGSGDLIYCESFGVGDLVKVVYSGGDISASLSTGTSFTLNTMPVPEDYEFGLLGTAHAYSSGSRQTYYLKSPSTTNTQMTLNSYDTNDSHVNVNCTLFTNTSKQIHSKANNFGTLEMLVTGYEIRR